MTEAKHSSRHMFLMRLSLVNMKRWKWRYLSIAFFIALLLILFVLYRGAMMTTQLERSMTIEPLETPFFSFLVALEEGDDILDGSDLGILIQNYHSDFRSSPPRFEAAYAAKVFSSIGHMELLGIDGGSDYLDSMEIEGRLATTEDEITLTDWAAERTLTNIGDTISVYAFVGERRLERTLRVVGIYKGTPESSFPLVSKICAKNLSDAKAANRMLVYVAPQEHLLEAMGRFISHRYPHHPQLSSTWPAQLSIGFFSTVQSSSLLGLILLFSGISILTIGLMTFLERRSEYATLKSIGLSNAQTAAGLMLENSVSLVAGILIGSVAIYFLIESLGLLNRLTQQQIALLWMQGAILSSIICFAALLFPLRTVQAATVHQLLYAQKIPLWNERVDYLQTPRPEDVLLEQEKQLRLLRLPHTNGYLDCLLLKRTAQRIRKGETIAVMESWGGFRFQEWFSPCDGTIIDIADNGLVSIKPDDPESCTYPYPIQLVEAARRQHDLLSELGR